MDVRHLCARPYARMGRQVLGALFFSLLGVATACDPMARLWDSTFPRRCRTQSDCPSGTACLGPPGCEQQGTCSRGAPLCTPDIVPYCLCDGTETTGSGSCPPFPYRSRGPCNGSVAVQPVGGVDSPASALSAASTGGAVNGGSPILQVPSAERPRRRPPRPDTAECRHAVDADGFMLFCDVPNIRCPEGYECRGEYTYSACMTSGCPLLKCLSSETTVATPSGEVLVRELVVGSLVWTVGEDGNRVAAPLLRTSRLDASPGHTMSRVVLDDGRQLLASPGHPTCLKGLSVGALAAHARFDHSVVVTADVVPYRGAQTFDILPAGRSGCYWANGVLVGSTLKEEEMR
jgi:hypothetical protein